MAPIAGPLVCLYVVELAALLSAFALQRRGDRSLLIFLASPAGWIGLAAVLALAVSVVVLVALARRVPAPRARLLAGAVVINLFSVTLGFVAVEALVRLLATPTIAGTAVGRTVLLPYRWTEVAARSRAALERAAAGQTYLVPDRDLGWSIGPNRQSVDYNREGVQRMLNRGGTTAPAPGSAADERIYLSSAEGLRSPRSDMSFAALPTKRRIAVVGDSFTFGLEVPYEGTWGHQLELKLGAEFQVLNFGVDGYGVDQAYLRYRRDAAAWRPEIVILGMIDDDFRRTMCVYAFLCFPGFGMPFSKPRLAVTASGLAPVNLPLAAPESLFTAPSIESLPFLEYDGSFRRADWTWRFYHHSDAIRFVLSQYPPLSTRSPVTPEAMRAVNTEVVRAFLKLARERGSIPIVVLFPSRSRLDGAAASVAKTTLEAGRIRFLDMTGCVTAVPPAERFVALHYSAATNAAIAGCLRESIAGGFQSS